jgi:hypothetical protein
MLKATYLRANLIQILVFQAGVLREASHLSKENIHAKNLDK